MDDASSHFGHQQVRDTTLSLRKYLVPKQTEPMTQSFRKQLKNIVEIGVLIAINDQAASRNEVTLKQRLVQYLKSFKKVIRPENPYLLTWQLLIVIIIIYYILEIGMIMGFGQSFWQDELAWFFELEIAFIIVLFLDILISPFKAYYSEGWLIKDIGLIFNRYIKFELYLDIIALLSVIIPLATGNVESNWIKILWFLKIYAMNKINEEFQRVTQLYITYNTIYLVMKLVVVTYFVGHFLGIIFYLVSLYLYNTNYYGPFTPTILWIYNSQAFSQMVFLTWYQMYTYAMYFSIQVISTIGYGDLTPKNPLQCLYIVFYFILRTVLWGYILSEILRLMIHVFDHNFSRRYHHYALNFKLKQSFISEQTFQKVQKHTEEIDKDEQYRNRKIEDKILSALPSEPLYGLLLSIYKQSLLKIGFTFAQNLTFKFKGSNYNKSVFLEHFMKYIKQQRHFPGQILYNQGEIEKSSPNNHCAYFYTNSHYKHSVVLGVGAHIDIVLDAKESQYEVIEKNEAFEIYRPRSGFGNVEFLNGQERSHWAICIQNCLLFSVSRQVMMNNYYMLTLQEKQWITLNAEDAQNKKCFICKQQHFFLHCPYSFVQCRQLPQPSLKSPSFKPLKIHQRSNPKYSNAWLLHPNISKLKMPITQQYKEKLYMIDAHDLLVELQLAENIQIQPKEIELDLLETQVIIQNLIKQELEELGLNEDYRSYQRAYDFEIYKPQSNISSIAIKIKKLKIMRQQRLSALSKKTYFQTK